MGSNSLNPNQRGPRATQDDVYGFSSSSSTSSSSINFHNSDNSKKKFSSFLPLFLALVFIAEIVFLGRLDLIKNADLVNSWAESFFQFTNSSLSTLSFDPIDEAAVSGLSSAVIDVAASGGGEESCEKWLEREDSVVYSRDFNKEPVIIAGQDEDWKSCYVGCKFTFGKNNSDAAFGIHREEGTARVLRSMESSHYYPKIEISMARRWSRI